MKIDLHVHSSERSPCGKATEAQQIQAAIAAKLDALVFTDHWQLVAPAHLTRLNQTFAPFKIFGGIEVVADDEDFIVIGVRDARLEKYGITYAELHDLVRRHAGFIALVHPFRYRNDIKADIERYRPDAIEVHSIHTPASAESKIRDLAKRLEIALLSNSDAHHTDVIGKYYNVLDAAPQTENELAARLRAGQFKLRD